MLNLISIFRTFVFVEQTTENPKKNLKIQLKVKADCAHEAVPITTI